MLYCEDNLYTMSNRIKDNSINLTVTSPPYNVDLGNNKYNKKGYDVYEDNKDYKDYLFYLYKRFNLLYQKTVDGGRCCINVGNQKNGRIPLVNDIMNMMLFIGWKVYTQIVWNKNQCSPRTAWGSFNSPSSPSFPTPFEFILVFSKGGYKLKHKGVSDLNKEEFIKFSLARWDMSTAKKSITKHPASFPEELPYRCIKMFSYIGDVIYDPFAGIGTTLTVGNMLNRKTIGSEISEVYCDIYNEKLKQ